MLRNGSFAYVTSNPTPDSWTVNATNATQTIPAATQPYTGNTFTYDKTLAGAAYALTGSAPSVAAGSFAVGAVLQMNVRIKVSNGTPSTASGFQLDLAAGVSGGHMKTSNFVQNGDYVLSHNLLVPAATTNFTPTLYVQDVALYEVNNWTLFNVTKANAIWQPGVQ
jgi:hypothetical protein